MVGIICAGRCWAQGASIEQTTNLRGMTDREAARDKTKETIFSPQVLEDTEPMQGNAPEDPPVGNINMSDTGSGQQLGSLTQQQEVDNQQQQFREQPPEPWNMSSEQPHWEGPWDSAGTDTVNVPPPMPHRFHPPNQIRQIQPSHPQVKALNTLHSQVQHPGQPMRGQEAAQVFNDFAAAQGAMQNSPQANFERGKSQVDGLAQGASKALADAFNPAWLQMLRLQNEGLLNVANEATGTPSSAFAITKTHRQAVWFVQRMYSEVYIPMAILLILPGAVLTQMKGMVAFGILSSNNDEDAVSPFSGILRGMIALFLIPATQLMCSYSIDVGNSLHHEVNRHVDPGLIFMWADEQVFAPPIANAANSIREASTFPVLGKLTQGPEAQSGLESQSTATAMLQTLANGMADSAAFGLVMLCAFQITMICYMLLMGPIAAAFYAWPAGMGNLFNRVFSTWLDAIINLSLWKFWWTVVLLCITVRLQWIGNPATWYSEWELLMFIAFLTILTYVPFNPFDYKAGEMVSKLMQKADAAVNEASKG